MTNLDRCRIAAKCHYRDPGRDRRGRDGQGVPREGYAAGPHSGLQDSVLTPFFRSCPQATVRARSRDYLQPNHPHICVLYGVGSQEGVGYLVMECMDGETLAKRLEKGALPLEQVLKYGMQIAGALDKAHRSSVLHRDLKPGNIMFTSSGAKLLDFGLAKPTAPLSSAETLTAETRNSQLTEQGTIGTFQYMSPEQIEGRSVLAKWLHSAGQEFTSVRIAPHGYSDHRTARTIAPFRS